MSKDLIVGSAGLQGIDGSISRFLSSRGQQALEAWQEAPDTIATLSCLNGATVMEFLKHAARVDGYEDERAGFAAGIDGQLSGKNFPWWDNSLWLPIDFDNPGGLDDDPTFFVGSCQRLVAELEDLQRRSSLRLGEAPISYNEMRMDFLKFVRSDEDLNLRAEDCVRWVWRALRDGSELAIAQRTALWAGPD